MLKGYVFSLRTKTFQQHSPAALVQPANQPLTEDQPAEEFCEDGLPSAGAALLKDWLALLHQEKQRLEARPPNPKATKSAKSIKSAKPFLFALVRLPYRKSWLEQAALEKKTAFFFSLFFVSFSQSAATGLVEVSIASPQRPFLLSELAALEKAQSLSQASAVFHSLAHPHFSFSLLQGSALPPPATPAAAQESTDALLSPEAVNTFSGGFLLQPVVVPKPWGEEIWYTGIEKRGVSGAVPVNTADGAAKCHLALPLVLRLLAWFRRPALTPLAVSTLTTPLLLKVLAPLPEKVFGELYYELHEKKAEAYVVTQVANKNTAAIRLGFSNKKRRQFSSWPAFKAAFKAAVQEYEVVRRRLDALLDEKALALKRSGTPLTVSEKKALLSELPATLLRQEEQKRKQMQSFSKLKPLRVGQVVKVLPFMPHSLQPGVRVVEFQTPHYERLIISFTQKVLTQPHWDTEKAFKLMRECVPEEPVETEAERLFTAERVALFPTFKVTKITLKPAAETKLPFSAYKMERAAESTPYFLLFALQGEVLLRPHPLGEAVPQKNKALVLSPQQAYFSHCEYLEVRNHSLKKPALYLKAEPLKSLKASPA